MLVTADCVNNAYTRLAAEMQTYHAAAQAAADARCKLEQDKAVATMNGEVQGKNAEQREAFCRELFAAQYAELEQLERTAAGAKLDFDLARLEVERVRCLLRVDELAAGAVDA